MQPFAKSQLQSAVCFLLKTSLENFLPPLNLNIPSLEVKRGEKIKSQGQMCWIMSRPHGWRDILAGITGYILQTLYLFSCFFEVLSAAVWQRTAVRQRLVMKRRATPSVVPLTNESRQRWSRSPLTLRSLPRWKKKGLANARPILPSHSLLSWMVSWEMWAPRGVHCENQRPRRPLVQIEKF